MTAVREYLHQYWESFKVSWMPVAMFLVAFVGRDLILALLCFGFLLVYLANFTAWRRRDHRTK